LKGERTPDESLAANPKAFLGCSNSGEIAIGKYSTSLENQIWTIFMSLLYVADMATCMLFIVDYGNMDCNVQIEKIK